MYLLLLVVLFQTRKGELGEKIMQGKLFSLFSSHNAVGVSLHMKAVHMKEKMQGHMVLRLKTLLSANRISPMNHYFQARNFKQINTSIIWLSIFLGSSKHSVHHSLVHVSSLVSGLGVDVAFG